MSETNQNRPPETAGPGRKPTGRLLALDLGLKRVGVAVSDELGVTARALPPIIRTSWKRLLVTVAETLKGFDAAGLVIGLPLNMDGTEGPAAKEARRLFRNFSLSLDLPVYLQDERLTTREAEEVLRDEGLSEEELTGMIDSASAVLILRDFLSRHVPQTGA